MIFSSSGNFRGRVTDSPRVPFTISGVELVCETVFPGSRQKTRVRDWNSQIMLLAVEIGAGDLKAVNVLANFS